MDIEKAAGLAFGASSPSSGNGRERSTAWTLSNILTETESLPVTPIAHSNPGSTHGRYVVASTKKGSALPIHRSRSVPAFNKDGSLRPSGVFRVILTPNMTPTRNINKLNDTSVDDGGEDVPEEEAVCRICLVELGEDSEAFKMECLCRGELALAHKECTIKWFTIKGNRTCDVCKQEVQNLPVTLLRMQDSQVGATEATTHYSVWQDVPVLVIVSMLAYFCFLEQLLVHMQPVVSILLATLVGFGLTMSGTTGIVQFSKWRRRRRTAEPPSSSQVDPPPVQSISGS
ncbi:RING/U-box superfamily protein [Raphanus sativus]|nr:RING/U-box superfamily protein [Raphanus sativus]